MLGWFREARSLASRWKRASRSASLANSAGSALIATSRWSRVSRARYTSPIPPEPRGEAISYDPNRVPRGIVISPISRLADSRVFPSGHSGAGPRCSRLLALGPFDLRRPVGHEIEARDRFLLRNCPPDEEKPGPVGRDVVVARPVLPRPAV